MSLEAQAKLDDAARRISGVVAGLEKLFKGEAGETVFNGNENLPTIATILSDAATALASVSALQELTDRAEAAADASQQYNDVEMFATYAALTGNLNWPDKQVGRVYADPDPTKNRDYAKSGASGVGSWGPVENYISTRLTAAESGLSTVGGKVNDAQPMLDTLKFVARVHDDAGNFYDFGLTSGTRLKFGISIRSRMLFLAGLKIQVSGDGSFHVMDHLGRSAFTITRKGRVIAPLLVQQQTGGNSTATPAAVLGLQMRTDIKHALVYGQSLSRGPSQDGGNVAISTTQPYLNVCFTSGVLTRPGDSGYDPSGFKPLIEQNLAGHAETPASGLCNEITRRRIAQGGTAAQWRFFGSSSGQGGESIEAISLGSDRFANLLKTIDDARAQSIGQGLSYSVWMMALYQGEQNYKVATSAADAYMYHQYELRLMEDVIDHLLKTGVQTFRPYLFTYQCNASRNYDRPTDTMFVDLAQWRASRIHPGVSLAVPCYTLPHIPNNVHLTGTGEWLMGAYTARAADWTMCERAEKWRPMEPTEVIWGSNYIDVITRPVYGPSVLDAACATAVPNFGFDVRNAADELLTDVIDTVTVVDRNRIRIATPDGNSGAMRLTYARGRPGDALGAGPISGPRGNLRDSHGDVDVVTDPLGVQHALHNPCVQFEHHRIQGF